MIEIRLADPSNFTIESLDSFSRYQEVKNVYRMIDGELKLVFNPFTEDWSPLRRRQRAAEILAGGDITYCAFDEGRVVGGIILKPKLNEGRMIVESFHVSTTERRKGIGRMLIETAKAQAAIRGAKSLYISACSAQETINFYMAMGCCLSPNPIREMVEAEPFDLQLECPV